MSTCGILSLTYRIAIIAVQAEHSVAGRVSKTYAKSVVTGCNCPINSNLEQASWSLDARAFASGQFKGQGVGSTSTTFDARMAGVCAPILGALRNYQIFVRFSQMKSSVDLSLDVETRNVRSGTRRTGSAIRRVQEIAGA